MPSITLIDNAELRIFTDEAKIGLYWITAETAEEIIQELQRAVRVVKVYRRAHGLPEVPDWGGAP